MQQPQSTGLASLGHVIAQAGGDYRQQVMSEQLRNEARQNQLADYERNLTDRRADTATARSNQLADEARRRDNAIIDEASSMLVKSGLLPVDWIKQPNSQELYAAALAESKRRGLAIEELAEIKAEVAADFSLSAAEKSFIMGANPIDPAAMERARAIGEVAAKNNSGRKQKQYTDDVEGTANLGAILSGLNTDKQRFQKMMEDSSIVTSAEMKQVDNELQAEFGKEYIALAVNDSKGILAAARKKKMETLQGIKQMQAARAGQALANVDNQIAAYGMIAAKAPGALASLGAAARTDAPPPPPPAPAGQGSTNDFLKPKVTPATLAVPVQAAEESGGLLGLLGQIPVAANDIYDLSRLVTNPVARGWDYFLGGDARLKKGDNARAGDAMSAYQTLNVRR